MRNYLKISESTSIIQNAYLCLTKVPLQCHFAWLLCVCGSLNEGITWLLQSTHVAGMGEHFRPAGIKEEKN